MKFLPTNFKTTCNAHLGKYSLAKGEQLRNNSVVFIPMREEEKVFIFQFLVIIQLYKVDNVAVFTDSNIFLRVCELLSIYKKTFQGSFPDLLKERGKYVLFKESYVFSHNWNLFLFSIVKAAKF